MKVRVISWNVNGIRALYKKNLLPFVDRAGATILCLQETKAHRDQVEPEIQTLGYSFSYWSSAIRKGYSGVATFSEHQPLRVEASIGFDEYENEGRLMITEYPQFLLYNIYFPNGGSGPDRHEFKQEFLRRLLAHLQHQIKSGKEIVVVGDYNIAHKPVDVYDPVRLAKESGFLPEEREWMDRFYDLGFVDSFRHCHQNEAGRYSWWSYREFARSANRGWRIDYISVTKGLVKYLRKADLWDRVEGSDHCPVVVDLDFGPD